MNEINEIKLPKGVESISVTQHDDKIVIEFIPEDPKFKEGDFVYEDGRIMIVKSYLNSYYALICPKLDMEPVYNGRYAPDMPLSSLSFRHATEEEKQLLIDALKKDGKRWNAYKKCIEDIPVYNHGDFLVSKGGYPFILDREGRSGESHYLFATSIYNPDVKSIQDSGGKQYCGYLKDASVADQETIKIIHDGLKSIGKCWNADKKCIEDIPQPKFKTGDKVKIKDGISSETHRNVFPYFTELMNELIGKELTVKEYTNDGSVVIFGDYFDYYFNENSLEPWSDELKKGDEPKKGDLAIFWDHDNDNAIIRLYDKKDKKDHRNHSDSCGWRWKNALKFESKEQFEKILRGEI